MKPIRNYKLVLVTINAGTSAGAVIQFPDVPELRGRKITGLEFYDTALMSVAPNQVAGTTQAQMISTTVTLKDFDETGLERLKDCPLATLQPINVAGIYKQFEPFGVNWQGSFVRYVGANVAAQFVMPFGVMYE
jgi:hypothetical protein